MLMLIAIEVIDSIEKNRNYKSTQITIKIISMAMKQKCELSMIQAVSTLAMRIVAMVSALEMKIIISSKNKRKLSALNRMLTARETKGIKMIKNRNSKGNTKK